MHLASAEHFNNNDTKIPTTALGGRVLNLNYPKMHSRGTLHRGG